MGRFFCQSCGVEVDAKADACPSCGKLFRAVRCPKCDFTGEGELFIDGCPHCSYGGSLVEMDSQSEEHRSHRHRKSFLDKLSGKTALLLLLPVTGLLIFFIHLLLRQL